MNGLYLVGWIAWGLVCLWFVWPYIVED